MSTEEEPAYTAVYWREGQYWLVELAEEPRVHTFARTLAKADENIRDAAALWFETDVSLKDEYRDLPPETFRVVSEAREARALMATAEARAAEVTREAADELLKVTGLSIRDAAHLLGISHQRLHQLVRERHARPTQRSRKPASNRRR